MMIIEGVLLKIPNTCEANRDKRSIITACGLKSTSFRGIRPQPWSQDRTKGKVLDGCREPCRAAMVHQCELVRRCSSTPFVCNRL